MRLEEIVKPETEEERNKRLQSEMILWHKKIRQLRNLIFPCLLLMILTSCEERIHNKLEILNLKGEILNSYDNISFIEYAGIPLFSNRRPREIAALSEKTFPNLRPYFHQSLLLAGLLPYQLGDGERLVGGSREHQRGTAGRVYPYVGKGDTVLS